MNGRDAIKKLARSFLDNAAEARATADILTDGAKDLEYRGAVLARFADQAPDSAIERVLPNLRKNHAEVFEGPGAN